MLRNLVNCFIVIRLNFEFRQTMIETICFRDRKKSFRKFSDAFSPGSPKSIAPNRFSKFDQEHAFSSSFRFWSIYSPKKFWKLFLGSLMLPSTSLLKNISWISKTYSWYLLVCLKIWFHDRKWLTGMVIRS